MNRFGRLLQIVYGCHCLDERSFHFKGKKFPICARCTGIFVGNLISIPLLFVYIPSFYLCVILMLPLIIDGTVQYLTKYNSNNFLRFITGLLWGYALINMMVIILSHAYHQGQKYAKRKSS